MSKRINIILPDSTMAVLDRVVPRGNRSRFIDRAVLGLVKSEGTANLKERLKAGALANAKLNLELAEEWFPVEQEAWQRLEREERAMAKGIRRGAVNRGEAPLSTKPRVFGQNLLY
jgi:CopG family transcriptional regulator/antitoxin EndoAI